MNFFDRYNDQLKNHPERIILCDDENTKGYSLESVDKISGRIYRYLKSKGIGREDFVMICLPRSARPVIAMLGVWKAGAAYVLVENTYAPERIEFIKKDCSCKFVLDDKTWDEAMACEYVPGNEPFEEHAAAFAVYTSGSTGTPKGVLHEYGQLDRLYESIAVIDGEPLTDPDKDRFALPAPLNFVASTAILIIGFTTGTRAYIVAYSVIKNPALIAIYYLKNKITGTFLTPSYLTKMDKMTPYMRFIIIGSEPASNIYWDGITIYNCYTMSETAYVAAVHKIDKKRDPTPIGLPQMDIGLRLVDESGNDVPDGEEGEIVFSNPYSRGYINLPEQTAAAFKDGMYYTGDLAKKNEEGQLVICGRKSDMFKINGNRVEPGEIETVARKVLGIDWAAAKGVIDPRQSFICVYYTANIEVDFEKTRKEMEKYLPYYMLPSFFIHIDKIPVKATGKMDRKALPEPKLEDYLTDYVAPRDEMETALCDAFAKVLHMSKVGITDDFYQLGGDSIASIGALSECGIKGLSAADIFAGHTVEKIIAIYREKHPNGVDATDEERDDAAMKKPHPLTTFQTYMIDYQLYTPMSTMLNLFVMLRLDKETYDMAKMPSVLDKVIHNHPALLTKFSFNPDGEMQQEYAPDLFAEIKIEKTTERELSKIKDSLVVPFKIMNSRLYRLRLFETEAAGYVFFDVHHTVFDGTSFQVLMGNIVKAYYDMPMERDYYYLTLLEKEEARETPRYLKSKEYFEENYSGDDFVGRPRIDTESRENELAHFAAPMQNIGERVDAVVENLKTSKNAFFNFVSMLSIAIYNEQPNVQISWTFNGRDDLRKANGIGLLLCDLPVAERFRKKTRIAELIKDVEKQINDGIAHSDYNFTLEESSCVTDDMVCFLYQEDIRDGGGDLKDANITMVDVRQNKAASENILDVQILDGSDGLSLLLDYNASCYTAESIEKFAGIFVSVTEAIVALSEKDGKRKTKTKAKPKKKKNADAKKSSSKSGKNASDGGRARVIDVIRLVRHKSKTGHIFTRWMK